MGRGNEVGACIGFAAFYAKYLTVGGIGEAEGAVGEADHVPEAFERSGLGGVGELEVAAVHVFGSCTHVAVGGTVADGVDLVHGGEDGLAHFEAVDDGVLVGTGNACAHAACAGLDGIVAGCSALLRDGAVAVQAAVAYAVDGCFSLRGHHGDGCIGRGGEGTQVLLRAEVLQLVFAGYVGGLEAPEGRLEVTAAVQHELAFGCCEVGTADVGVVDHYHLACDVGAEYARLAVERIEGSCEGGIGRLDISFRGRLRGGDGRKGFGRIVVEVGVAGGFPDGADVVVVEHAGQFVGS